MKVVGFEVGQVVGMYLLCVYCVFGVGYDGVD